MNVWCMGCGEGYVCEKIEGGGMRPEEMVFVGGEEGRKKR